MSFLPWNRGERREPESLAPETAAELATLRVRLEELEDQRRFDSERLDVLGRDREGLRTTLATVRAHSEELHSTLSAEQREGEQLRLGLERQRAEQRVLVRHLVRTETVLQARTEQLTTILASRWHRVARSTWQLRRRRPPLGALALFAIAFTGVILALVLASTVATALAGILGAGFVALAGAAYAIVVPAMRDKRTPRLAGSGTFADALPDERATLEELRAQITAPAQASAAGATAPRAAQPAPAAPAPAAPAAAPVTTTVAAPTRPPAKLATRLVPAILPAPADRDAWTAAGRTRELSQLHVAGILDDMSRACFAPECRLNCEFTMTDWQERLAADPPHLLLVESAWSGNSGGWQYGVASYTHPDYRGLPQLRGILDWCREGGIPTVFWNKEDPVHFERFKEAAALFDHIFTTDANCIPRYEALAGPHVRSVSALPFAAQPRLHNPIPISATRSPEPVFAGTYYRNRHIDRRTSLEMILDAARPFGLAIYDRTFGTTSEEYGFPERFLPHVRGRLPYDRVVATYKRHRVFLNVNSVTDSPTMFSRRVFELLACGTAVLSTESVGMQAIFGDLVPVAESLEDATAKLDRLLHDEAYHTDLVGRASRLVLSQHTYRERLAEIVRTAGFEITARAGEEISALVLADSAEDLNLIDGGFLAQSRAPEEILVGVSGETLAGPGLDRLIQHFGAARVRTIVQEPATDRGDRWRELAALAASPWVAPWQRVAGYGEHHVRDLGAATRFAEADVIGFAPADAPGERYADAVEPAEAIARREVVAARGWAETSADQERWFEQGVRLYASTPSRPLNVSSGSSAGTPGVGRRRRTQRR